MNKAVGSSVHVPSRPLGGWLMTYGKIGPSGGIVPTVDRQGHIVEAARELGHIDWSEYLKGGRWNDTHLKDEATGRHLALVGLPSVLEFHDGTTELAKAHRKVGFWTAGHLFDRNDPASWSAYGDYVPTPHDLDRSDYFWDLAQLLKGTPRPLGLSAEGDMALDDSGTRIVFARVRQAAVCELPQNPDTTLEPMQLGLPGPLLDTPLQIMAKAIAVAQGSEGVSTENAATRAVVPEDLEGAPASTPKAKFDRLVAILMERYSISESTARTWIKRFLLRRER